jgi:ADP-ribosylglycohydrolase
MPYPKFPSLGTLIRRLETYAELAHERGATGVQGVVDEFVARMEDSTQKLAALPVDAAMAAREPDDLDAIRALRPPGPRRMWRSIPDTFATRLEGAFLARCAGCTLGATVEAWPYQDILDWAAENGDDLPPTDYWLKHPHPRQKRYNVATFREYTRGHIDGVPADDDLAYTMIGLLIAEQFGPHFTTADVGAAWAKYLPLACTAEEVALANLKKGIPAEQAGAVDNPYCDWLGADIRCDPWAYIAPGWPEKAAELAYRDALLSHRRQGIYGAMFYAAAISAAFVVDDPLEAIRIGLTEIPADCGLAQGVRWTLDEIPRVRTFDEAKRRVGERFAGMYPVHVTNNACNVVFGIGIGGRDVTRVIGNVVCMWLDVDCNAATAGSIVGAVVGKAGIAPHWYRPFNNTIKTYLIGHERFAIDDSLKRFAAQAQRVFAEG